jgi:hypothetical protein
LEEKSGSCQKGFIQCGHGLKCQHERLLSLRGQHLKRNFKVFYKEKYTASFLKRVGLITLKYKK